MEWGWVHVSLEVLIFQGGPWLKLVSMGNQV